MIKIIRENVTGTKHQDEGLPCSTAAEHFDRCGGRYKAFIVTEYRDPFASFCNDLPQEAADLFESIVTESSIETAFGENSFGEELFFDMAIKTDQLLYEMAPHDIDTANNFSMCCVLINTATMDTKIACRGRNVRILITNKDTGEIEHVWPKKDSSGSLCVFGFSLRAENNILICNDGLYRNIYSLRNDTFYSGYGKVITSPFTRPFYFESLNDMAYIGIDLG